MAQSSMPLGVRVPYEWKPRDGGDYEKNEWNQWYCWHCYRVADESHVDSSGHIKKVKWHKEERQRIGAQPPPGFCMPSKPSRPPPAWSVRTVAAASKG